MLKLDKLYDIGEAVKFIEEELKAELKKEGLKEVVADFLDCKRWFAESFRCPINAAELKRIVDSAKSRTLLALKEEGIKNSEFMIKNVEYIQDRDTKDYIMRCTIYFEEEEVKAVPTEEKLVVKGCPIKQIAQVLLKVANAGNCQRCDGCGYFEGCNDQECGTYAAYKSLDLLGVEIEE